MNLVAVFVPSKIIVILSRVSENVHDSVIVAHKVISDIDEDTNTFRVVIPDRVNEAGVAAVIPVVRHFFRIYNYFVLVSNFVVIIIIINNSICVCCVSRFLQAASTMTARAIGLLVVNEFTSRFS